MCASCPGCDKDILRRYLANLEATAQEPPPSRPLSLWGRYDARISFVRGVPILRNI
jgi:hypothetical protein